MGNVILFLSSTCYSNVLFVNPAFYKSFIEKEGVQIDLGKY